MRLKLTKRIVSRDFLTVLVMSFLVTMKTVHFSSVLVTSTFVTTTSITV
ncbi:Uncharacterised protein [Klebsiella pneumoniae]|nr:Uncharacterised protein [Klebsiella pneumoniae]